MYLKMYITKILVYRKDRQRERESAYIYIYSNILVYRKDRQRERESAYIYIYIYI